MTGVQADSANVDDLDRLFDAVRQDEGAVDVCLYGQLANEWPNQVGNGHFV